MKKVYTNCIKLLCLIMLTATFISNGNISYSAPATAVKQNVTASQTALNVTPSAVVNNPEKYLNKTITFTADFIAFTSLGLDYKPALRDAGKYIGILIKRDDVSDHVIPLSEMKIFLDRETAEKHVDLDQGDKIKITGTVFSTALGDPWVDVKSFTVLTQKNKNKDSK